MNDEQSNQDKHVVVATKLSRQAAERLAKIAKHKGMTIYELIQMVCDTLIRYMRAMSIFEHMVGWADALNLADPTVQKEIAQAVYIFQDANGAKKGFRAVMVDKPFMGQWTEDQNVMHIFNRIFNICMPDLYMKLFRARILLGCNNVSEVINLLADAQVIMHLNDEYRKDFEDADRADNGHAVQYGQKTKGLQHRTPDSVAQDQRFNFDDYDREVADYEVEGWEGEHKQDEEPPEGIRPFDVEY